MDHLVGPRIAASEVWDHAATVLDRTLKVETQFELSRSSHISVYRALNRERLRPVKLPQLNSSQQIDLTLSVRPTPSFTIDTTAVWSALGNSNSSIFSNRIVRTRWNYQVTRRLSARAITQFEDLDANRALTALVARRRPTLICCSRTS
jgi:hypothetical protein